MKKLFSLIAAAMLLSACGGNDTVKSPDGKVAMRFSVLNGEMVYSVSYGGKTALEDSPLGITSSAGDFSTGLTLKSSLPTVAVHDNYVLPFGKKRDISYKANEAVYVIENGQGESIEVVFRVSDDGVAFCYNFKNEGSVEVTSEKSGFKLPSDALAFITPLSKAKSGWEHTNPSYEEPYHLELAVGTPSDFGQGWTYPALFKTGENWILISETNVDRNYVGTHLADDSSGGLYKVEFPHADHNLPTDPASATFKTPFRTPWRTINAGSLASVVESTMAQDLAEPLYAPKYEYKPGKATWSWIILKDDQTVYDVQKEYIDMAEKLGWEYILIDSHWDVQIGREKIAELTGYAAKKGVGVLLWYNSNGFWNTAPQSPKERMNTKEARAEEMKWMQSIGVKGIKVDFFGGDKQFVMELYDDILRDGNDHGLAVNFHGTTLPRGWERMYPNFVTDEAVKGQEFITFEQPVADRQPAHCATLIFTRNVVAPMDFTPLALNERLGERKERGPVRRTTAAFELALPVLFFSAVQHMALVPDNLDEFPQFVFDYLEEVPTVWDETKLLAGYPGKDAVMARRSGDKWYIAGINGEEKEKTVDFTVDFIRGSKTVKTILDTDEWNHVKFREETTDFGGNPKYSIALQPNGGFIMTVE